MNIPVTTKSMFRNTFYNPEVSELNLLVKQRKTNILIIDKNTPDQLAGNFFTQASRGSDRYFVVIGRGDWLLSEACGSSLVDTTEANVVCVSDGGLTVSVTI